MTEECERCQGRMAGPVYVAQTIPDALLWYCVDCFDLVRVTREDAWDVLYHVAERRQQRWAATKGEAA